MLVCMYTLQLQTPSEFWDSILGWGLASKDLLKYPRISRENPWFLVKISQPIRWIDAACGCIWHKRRNFLIYCTPTTLFHKGYPRICLVGFTDVHNKKITSFAGEIQMFMQKPYGSKHCLRRYLTLQIIVNYTPNTSWEGTWIHRVYIYNVSIYIYRNIWYMYIV